jgi:hypothetical protein
MQRVLMVNPPIYDFTAYDFWLRPYGILRVAGRIETSCRLRFFDYLVSKERDSWGRGRYPSQPVAKPRCFDDIPRRFRRFGRPREEFRNFLRNEAFDAALIQTGMTYWYLGIKEVIEDVRELRPQARIVLGGVYATLCLSHARGLGADLVIEGSRLEPLWQLLSIEPGPGIPVAYPGHTGAGVIKITEGCPFRCSYCSSSLFYPRFRHRPTAECILELKNLVDAGARNVAFYDDALLFEPELALVPFLKEVSRTGCPVRFHTPNALNARFITADLARLMVRSGFMGFYIGLESTDHSWQNATGGKIHAEEYAAAVDHLLAAGAESIITYIIVGHPDTDSQDLESSMRFAQRCGSKILLSEFSPIPGTPDGNRCETWADMDEPLSHNKTAFAIRRLGFENLNSLKELARSLNAALG